MWLLAIMEVSAHATDPVPSALAPFGDCKWSGTEVKIDGQELLIMKESDILGIIEGKASVRAAA